MTGSQKIIAKIKEDSAQNCAEILNEAKKQIEKIRLEALTVAEEKVEEIKKQTNLEVLRIENAAKSSAELKKRNLLLKCKRQEIEKILQEAVDVLCNLQNDVYFETLLKIANKIALSGKGVMCLNLRDLKRMPVDFAERLSKIADISISDQPVEILGGFILVYGDIELNADFSALIEEKRNVLEDIVSSDLFK